MKNTVFVIAFCFFLPLYGLSQSSGDTITVQTLSFADITKRRGWYIFPKDTNQYHKILMYYTLKCDAATTQDNYPCGEWDYTTYTNLFKHKNINTPYYYLGNSTPPNLSYLNEPKYDIYQHYDYVRNITSSSNEDSCVLGNGTVVSNDFLNGQEIEELESKKALVRFDYNVPMDNGEIVNDFRIRKSLQTIKMLLDNNNKIIIIKLPLSKYDKYPVYKMKKYYPEIFKLYPN